MQDQKITEILILFAMSLEAKSFLSEAKLIPADKQLDPDLPATVYKGKVGNKHITCIISENCPLHHVERIATQPATLLAWEGIKYAHPQLIINAGTCGALQKKNTEIGDVYGSHQYFVYHDRLMQPAEAYINYGLGCYPAKDFSEIYAQIGVSPGIISTGNALEFSEAQAAVFKQINADAKDMELAAIAEVAMLKKIPLIGLKTVSDFIDHHEAIPDQFLKNYQMAVEKLTLKLLLLIREL